MTVLLGDYIKPDNCGDTYTQKVYTKFDGQKSKYRLIIKRGRAVRKSNKYPQFLVDIKFMVLANMIRLETSDYLWIWLESKDVESDVGNHAIVAIWITLSKI